MTSDIPYIVIVYAKFISVARKECDPLIRGWCALLDSRPVTGIMRHTLNWTLTFGMLNVRCYYANTKWLYLFNTARIGCIQRLSVILPTILGGN